MEIFSKMDVTTETINYSAFDIQYEFFPNENCLYDFDSKENAKQSFSEVEFQTANNFESSVMDEKLRLANISETSLGSPLFNNFTDNSNPSNATNSRQYYAYRTSQFQSNRFESDTSYNQSDSPSPVLDSSSASSSSGGRVFVCSYCNKGYTSEKYLSMHMSLHNVTPNNGGESNTAQLIVEEFKNQGICPIERTKAKGNSKAASWTCKICMKTFAQNSNYKNHIRTHSNERPFVCDTCSIGFKERYHLKKHVLFVHTSEMKEKCKFCGKKFKDSTAVRAHERTHSDLRPYVCLRCNKAFKTSECLWHHEHRSKACVKNYLRNNPGSELKKENKKSKRIHKEKHKDSLIEDGSPELFQTDNIESSREYVKVEQNQNLFSNQNIPSQTCAQYNAEPLIGSNSMYPNFGADRNGTCKRAEQSNLNNMNNILYDKSFSTTIPLKSSSPLSDRPYRSDECDDIFKLKIHLKKHLNCKHTNKFPRECRICGKHLEDLSAMKLHEKEHSDDRSFQCQCGKTFKTNENLWDHQQRGLCEFSYELTRNQEPSNVESWHPYGNDYFGANSNTRSQDASLIPSQEIITICSSASHLGVQSQPVETLPRIDSWKLMEEKQIAGSTNTDQHPSIPTAIVVPMKRIPSNMFTQQVVSPNKKQHDTAFLPPFETFNDAIPSEVTSLSHEGNQFKPKIQQKLPDIQCMLQSFPQNHSFSSTSPSATDLVQYQNGDGSDFKNFIGVHQPTYFDYQMEDFRYNGQFTISYNF